MLIQKRSKLVTLLLTLAFVLISVGFLIMSTAYFIILAIIIWISITVFIFIRYPNKAQGINSLFQTIIVIIALGIAYISFNSSNEASKESIKALKDLHSGTTNINTALGELKTKLESLPPQIERFSHSISNLDSVIQLQQDQLQTGIVSLKNNIRSLNDGIKEFRNSIGVIKTELTAIRNLEEQKNEREIKLSSQRPILIVTDGNDILSDSIFKYGYTNKIKNKCEFSIQNWILRNKGNRETKINYIRLFLTEPLEFDGNWENEKLYETPNFSDSLVCSSKEFPIGAYGSYIRIDAINLFLRESSSDTVVCRLFIYSSESIDSTKIILDKRFKSQFVY